MAGKDDDAYTTNEQLGPLGKGTVQKAVTEAAEDVDEKTTWEQQQRRGPYAFHPAVSFTILGIIAYGVLWFLLGDVVAPGGGVTVPNGAVWCVIFIWLGAMVSGKLAAKVNLPPLLGMLLGGMLLRNLPGELVEDLPKVGRCRLTPG